MRGGGVLRWGNHLPPGATAKQVEKQDKQRGAQGLGMASELGMEPRERLTSWDPPARPRGCFRSDEGRGRREPPKPLSTHPAWCLSG